jgi:MFS family permease
MWFRQKNAWQQNKDQQRGWLFSIAPWLVVVALLASAIFFFWDDNLFISLRKFLWLGLAIVLLLILYKNRTKKSSWSNDDLVFEPKLSRPVSSMEQELEWKWTNHPLIRFPLAFALIPLIYWVLVIHKMKLPGSWLVGIAVFTLITIWTWHEPLILMLLVATGVGLLYVTGWVINNLELTEIVGLLCVIAFLIFIAVKELKKRNIIR